MARRYLITALALVVALAAITPTLGAAGTQSLVDKSAFPVRTAKKAKQIAKRAKAIAREANAAAAAAQTTASDAASIADQAKSDAAAAQNTANGAAATANTAKGTADATAAELAGLRAKTDTDAPTVTTTEQNTYVDLGGPSVTVTVPASGLIEVWAQISTVDGAVSLFEDGQQVPNQDPDDNCLSFGGGPPPPTDPLLAGPGGGPPPITLSTPGSVSFAGCGSTTAPAPVLFKTSPGQHTYDLRYASCGCSAPAPAEFADRMLTVAPRP